MNAYDIARECPRWERCSVNNCPLDPHPVNYSDNETRCTVAKSIRIRISEKFPGELEHGGLTRAEWAGKQIWEKKTGAAKLKFVEGGKIALDGINRPQPGENDQNLSN